MNRREIIQAMFGGAVAIALPDKESVSAPVADEMVYRGFRLKWSGWQKPVNQCAQLGVWYGINPNSNRFHVYSTYPGVTGKCFETQLLNYSLQEGQECPLPWSTPEQLARYRQDAFERLVRYIREHREELV